MTVFAGGWICPECWTPNRSRDNYCVGCGEHGEDSMGETPEAFSVPTDLTDNPAALPHPLGALVAAVGALWMVSAVVSLFMYMVQVGFMAVEVSKYGDSRAAMFVLVGGFLLSPVALLLAWLCWKLGTKIIDGARWAWVVGLLLAVPPVAAYVALMKLDPNSFALLPPYTLGVVVPSAIEATILLLAIVVDLTRTMVRAR